MSELRIFGEPRDEGAVAQIENVMRDERAVAGALMADHHLGYSMPIGGLVRSELNERGITVLGSGADEAPAVYKDLGTVLAQHANIEVLHILHPVGVVMAGEDTFDPYKD